MRKNQYSSAKRRKELDRKKKQEEKRLRRLNKGADADPPESDETEGTAAEPTEEPASGSPAEE